MYFYRHLFFALVAFLLCGSIPTRSANAAQEVSTPCLEKSGLSSKLAPPYLWKSIASCISSEKYEQGVFIYAVAGAFGRFDTLRVADKSAHQAIKALPMLAFGSLPKDKVAAFQLLVRQTLENETIRKTYCVEVESLGHPVYYPSYMIQHGLGAFTGANNNLPASFELTTAWPQAVKEYLLCP